jgi:hypothetical protein
VVNSILDELEKTLENCIDIETSHLDRCVDKILKKSKAQNADAEAILVSSLEYYVIEKYKHAYVLSMVAVLSNELTGNRRTWAYYNAGRAAFFAGTIGIDLFPKDPSVILYFLLDISKKNKMLEYESQLPQPEGCGLPLCTKSGGVRVADSSY